MRLLSLSPELLRAKLPGAGTAFNGGRSDRVYRILPGTFQFHTLSHRRMVTATT